MIGEVQKLRRLTVQVLCGLVGVLIRSRGQVKDLPVFDRRFVSNPPNGYLYRGTSKSWI